MVNHLNDIDRSATHSARRTRLQRLLMLVTVVVLELIHASAATAGPGVRRRETTAR